MRAFAQAALLAYLVSLAPALVLAEEIPPGYGSARLEVDSIAALGSDSPMASELRASLGLPMASALTLHVPALRHDDVALGSPALQLNAFGSFRLSATLRLDLVAGFGARFASLQADPSALGGALWATDATDVRALGQVTLRHRSSLSVHASLTDEPSLGIGRGELSYSAWRGQAVLSVGGRVLRGQVDEEYLGAALQYRPEWKPEIFLRLYGRKRLRGDDSLAATDVLGISLGFDLSLSKHTPEPGREYLEPGYSSLANFREHEMPDGTRELGDDAIPGRVTILAFKAWWCTPCRDVDRELRKLASAHQEIEVRTLKVSEYKNLTAANQIAGLPTVILYDKEGIEIDRQVGYSQRRFDQLLQKARSATSEP